MTRNTHLSDDRLIEICLDRSPSPVEREHLAACAACGSRHEGVSDLLADASAVATEEADVLFTPDRMARQRTRILQRLEHEGRPGRVVAFPAGRTRPVAPMRARPGMRWVAGAAAAGLVIGMLAGHYADVRLQNTQSEALGDVPPSAPAVQAVSAVLSEEEFLGRLEMAVEGTSGSALGPLHELTPLVWEVSTP